MGAVLNVMIIMIGTTVFVCDRRVCHSTYSTCNSANCYSQSRHILATLREQSLQPWCHMSVALNSLRFLAASLTALVTASTALAQETTGGVRPTAATLAAKIDSVVQLDVLGQGMPSVSIAVTRGNETLV